jgi:hypothetical protein
VVPRLLVMAGMLLAVGCAAHRDDVLRSRADGEDAAASRRLVNLKRAAQYPWTDDGRCVVREAAGEWATLVERCYDALALSRIQFVDRQGICPVAQAGAIPAGDLVRLVGICLLVQPELAVGAVIIIGAVVVAAAIAAEIEAAERARKPGCYCKCLKVGEGPFIENGRVASPAVCAELCRKHPLGFTGSTCK